MTKLTQGMREKITNRVLRHRFEKEYLELCNARANLAEGLYVDRFSKKDRQLMASLPDGWLPQCDGVHASVEGDNHTYAKWDFNGRLSKREVRMVFDHAQEVTFPFPQKKQGVSLKVYAQTEPLGIEINRVMGLTQDFYKAFDAAKSRMMAVLKSVSTLNALKTVWPDVAPFVEDLAPEPRQLPALPVAELNTLFDLPKEEA